MFDSFLQYSFHYNLYKEKWQRRRGNIRKNYFYLLGEDGKVTHEPSCWYFVNFILLLWVSGLKSLRRWRLFLGGGLWWVGWCLGWDDSLCRIVDRTPVLDRTMYKRNEKSYGDAGRKKLGGLALAPLSFFPWWCCCYIGHRCSNRLRTVNLWEPTWSLDPGPCCGGA